MLPSWLDWADRYMAIDKDFAGGGEPQALRRLVRNSTDLLATHAPDGTYQYVSPSCRALLGYEPDELVGTSPYDLVHPDDVGEIRAIHEQVLQSPQLRTAECRLRRADGPYAWFEITSHSILDPGSGAVVEIDTSARDVTERKQAQLQLAESEQRFRLAMANAPIGMALVGLDGSWLEVNERVCEIVGRTCDELLAVTFQDITHPDDLGLDLEYMQQLLDGERDRYTMEKRYIHADGHVVWIMLSGSVVHDDAGRPIHFIAQIEDITERRRREQELHELNKQLTRSNVELERFALVASHDLRSPLAAVAGFLELMPRFTGELSPSGQDVLDRAIRNVHRSLETVDALLELARVGRRGEVANVETQAIIDELRDLLAEEIEESGVMLEVDVLPTVAADPAQLRVLFQNLVANAIRYREPGRPLQVGIAARPSGDRWTFVVTDNGRGFEPEDREIIFAPFGRRSTGEKIEGIGIGLATCRRIVEQYGGKLTAAPLDPGAQFTFTLPAAGTDDPA